MTASPAQSVAAPTTQPGGIPQSYAVPAPLVAALTRRLITGGRPELRTVVTPMTGQALYELPCSSRADVEVAIDHARGAQRAWSRLPIEHRARIIMRVHDLVLDRQVQLLDLMQLESGKTRLQAFEEIADVALVARHYARAGGSDLASKRAWGAYPVLTRAETIRQPYGVVGIVSPWNYPFTLPIGDSLPALLAGNAVVLRPDPQTTLTALFGAQILADAGLPDGVLQVVSGEGPTVGQAVVDLADYVCYTGSTEVGRAVAQTAARRLVPSSLELGGKNTLYVRSDADLRRAVPGAVRASFGSAGQLCVHAERVVLHESIADAFLADFVPAVAAMRLGPALEYGVDMGTLVSQRQLDRVQAHVADAVAKGAQVLVGGHARPDLGPFFHEPTVLAGVTPDMACRNDETFGPVVSIYRVRSDEDAIALANDTAYGLNASIWSRDVRAARALARRIRAGTVNINDGYAAAWGASGAPMGGMGQSGLGRRHGPEGITKYTESQTIAAQHLVPIAPFGGLDDRQFATALTAGLKLLRRAGLR